MKNVSYHLHLLHSLFFFSFGRWRMLILYENAVHEAIGWYTNLSDDKFSLNAQNYIIQVKILWWGSGGGGSIEMTRWNWRKLVSFMVMKKLPKIQNILEHFKKLRLKEEFTEWVERAFLNKRNRKIAPKSYATTKFTPKSYATKLLLTSRLWASITCLNH